MKVLHSGAFRRTDRTQWRRRRLTLVTLLAIAVALVISIAGALADAGNPILGTIRATAVDNGDGTVTVFVRGQWNWYSHSSDCNVDRAGAGVGLIWNDPTEPGYTVSKGNVSAGVGIAQLRPGDTVNSIDRMVHPADVGNLAEGYPGAAGQVFLDPPVNNPALFAAWKGGCGREPLTATASPGPLTPLEPSGKSCGDGTTACSGHPWGSWGYSKNEGEGYSHTYLKSALPSEVCVNFYDVHGKLQVVNGAKEITVDQNGDNSIQTNAFNVNVGANCVSLTVSELITNATDTTIGGSISDTATLSGIPANAGGTLTFAAYGPRALTSTTPDCSAATPTYTTTINVTGAGDYSSDPTPGTNPADDFTPSAVGKYDWKVDYSGNGLVLPAHSACGAATIKETSSVVPASPTVITDAGPTVALQDGSASLTDKATLAGGTSDISGSITFQLFADNGSGGCGDQVGSDSVVTVDHGNGDYTSGAIVVHTAGTYHWIANYGGDAKNNKTANTCNGANENVTVLNPGILISKDPKQQTIVSGSTANFTILVKNTGDSTLTNVHVDDPLSPDCSRTAAQIALIPQDGTNTMSSTFAPGASVHYTCSLADVTASFLNTATATGTPPTGPDVTADSSADVTVVHPNISVTKGPADQTILKNGSATFTITVENTGDVALLNVAVTDAQAPGCALTASQVAAIPQDTTGIMSSTLQPGASFHYQCTLGNVTDSFTNSATGCGTPDASGNPADVCSTGTAHVTVINPSIQIIKDPKSQTVDSGGTATFTITVTNPDTSSTLTNVHVDDPLAPDCSRTAAQIAAIPPHNSSTFAPGDSVSYTCTAPNLTDSFTNLATATGTPAVGPDVTDTDTASVTVNPPPPPPPAPTHPGISITKNPASQTVTVGGTVNFTITVTNSGDVTLTNVNVADALSPLCSKTASDVPAFVSLAPGASATYTCTSAAVSASFTNVAIATGTPPTGPNVSSQASAAVVAQTPATPVTPKKKPKVISHKKPKATG